MPKIFKTAADVADHVRRTLNATTYVKLSAELGLSKSYLSMVFAGKRMPLPDVLDRLGRKFGLTVDEMYRYLKSLRQQPRQASEQASKRASGQASEQASEQPGG